MTVKDAYTAEEIAEELGITTVTVYKYIRRGALVPVSGVGEKGSPYLIPKAEVDLLRSYLTHPFKLRLERRFEHAE